MHRGNHETHQHSAVDPFHLLCCDFVVTNRTTMETQNHHIRCSGCGPGILIGMRERLPGLLRLWNYLSSICRIEPLGGIAPGERNRGGRETRVGIRRLEPLLSRPGPPLDRTRHAGHMVGLLKRVDNPGHSARGYENASDPRRNLPSPNRTSGKLRVSPPTKHTIAIQFQLSHSFMLGRDSRGRLQRFLVGHRHFSAHAKAIFQQLSLATQPTSGSPTTGRNRIISGLPTTRPESLPPAGANEH